LVCEENGDEGELTEVEKRNQRADHHSAFLEQIRWEECSRRELLSRLPYGENEENHAANDQHSNHTRIRPLPLRIRREREREQDERDRRAEQQQAEEIDIDREILHLLHWRLASKHLPHIQPQLLRPPLIHEQAEKQRNEAHG
jgi:hypothetical protein